MESQTYNHHREEVSSGFVLLDMLRKRVRQIRGNEQSEELSFDEYNELLIHRNHSSSSDFGLLLQKDFSQKPDKAKEEKKYDEDEDEEYFNANSDEETFSLSYNTKKIKTELSKLSNDFSIDSDDSDDSEGYNLYSKFEVDETKSEDDNFLKKLRKNLNMKLEKNDKLYPKRKFSNKELSKLNVKNN